MDARPWCRRLLRRGARAARRAARALGAAGQRLAQRLAYRPREVVVVGLLAAGLFGGLLVERWRARHPAIAERLEAEPARPTSPTPVPAGARVRPRPTTARCAEPEMRGSRLGRASAEPTRPRLDLNRVTPGELARVAGISWRLAARIVAAREAFEGREERRIDPVGPAPSPVAEPAAADTPEGDTPEAPPDAESP